MCLYNGAKAILSLYTVKHHHRHMLCAVLCAEPFGVETLHT